MDRKPSGTMMLLVAPLVLAVAMIVIGWLPTWARGGRPAIEAMLWAQGLLLLVVYLSLLPILMRLVTTGAIVEGPALLKRTMLAGGLRFLMTLAIVGIVLIFGWLESKPFLLWIGMGYVVMTVVESFVLARWLKNIQQPPLGQQKSTQKEAKGS